MSALSKAGSPRKCSGREAEIWAVTLRPYSMGNSGEPSVHWARWLQGCNSREKWQEKGPWMETPFLCPPRAQGPVSGDRPAGGLVNILQERGRGPPWRKPREEGREVGPACVSQHLPRRVGFGTTAGLSSRSRRVEFASQITNRKPIDTQSESTEP